jgi:phosphatidylinositol-3,4,5-trisphosphate 3-phosphatase and dual-specificity protein phosphatase PTEN
MVESLRKLVSGNRRRFVEDDYSLDLTYITPGRIIAMSYPASGFESVYRNPIDKASTSLPHFALSFPHYSLS